MGSTTFVDSVVYSMAGDDKNIPNFLKTVVIGGVLTNPPNVSMGDHLTASMLAGPGMRLRNFHRWAKKRYTEGNWGPGIPNDYLITDPSGLIDSAERSAELQRLTGYPEALFSYHRIVFEDPTKAPPYAEAATWPLYYAEFPSINSLPTDQYICRWNPTTRMATWQYLDETVAAPTPPRSYYVPPGNEGTQWIRYGYFKDSPDVLANKTTRFYYRVGSGSEKLDKDQLGAPIGEEFLPLIPLRLNNVSVSSDEGSMPLLYAQLKKGYKQAFNAKLDSLLKSVEDNESINDIDYAFIIFGVSLNSKRPIAQRYMFDYFESLETRFGYRGAFQVSIATDPYAMPGNNGDEWSTNMLRQSIFVESIAASTGTGLMKPGAKTGEIWIRGSGTNLQLTRQVTANSHKTLTITGLVHINEVYGGTAIRLEGGAELLETDPSGFIVPMSYETLKRMPLVKANQLALEGSQIVFNCYQVVKTRWYEEGFFKVFVVFIVVLITFASGGLGAGSVGLLGANAAVGAAIGFTGVAAVIAGVVANAIAAMIVTKIITAVSVELLGEEVGRIVGAIASFITVSIGSGLQAGQSMAEVFSGFMDPSTLTYFTSSTINGVSGAMAAKAAEFQRQSQEIMEDYKKETENIEKLSEELFGSSDFFFNPQQLTEATAYIAEGMDSFLQRTLMTGMDIADLTNEAINLFPSVTTSTKLA